MTLGDSVHLKPLRHCKGKGVMYCLCKHIPFSIMSGWTCRSSVWPIYLHSVLIYITDYSKKVNLHYTNMRPSGMLHMYCRLVYRFDIIWEEHKAFGCIVYSSASHVTVYTSHSSSCHEDFYPHSCLHYCVTASGKLNFSFYWGQNSWGTCHLLVSVSHILTVSIQGCNRKLSMALQWGFQLGWALYRDNKEV